MIGTLNDILSARNLVCSNFMDFSMGEVMMDNRLV